MSPLERKRNGKCTKCVAAPSISDKLIEKQGRTNY